MVEFSSEAAAKEAVKKMHNFKLNDRPIRVGAGELAQPHRHLPSHDRKYRRTAFLLTNWFRSKLAKLSI